jgi:hypothetical protein
MMAKGGQEAANPPAVAFQNTLDHGNAGITPGYPQNPICHPLHPAANAHAKPELPLGLYSCAEKNHLATYI